MDRELISAFVGKNSSYYDKKWSFDNEQPSAHGFNFAAAILFLFWILYRRLYLHFAFIVLVIAADVTITTRLEEIWEVAAQIVPIWDRISPLFYGLIAGTFANKWYLGKFMRAYSKAYEIQGTSRARATLLRKSGGTNWVGPILLLLAVVGGMYALIYAISISSI